MRPRTTVAALAVAALALAATLLIAGPLDPPPGAVAGTLKTLTEVEPRIAVSAANTPGTGQSVYTIVTPGSYYLTGNVIGEVGKHGILIQASNVTLDLNGFELAGIPGMGSFSGVHVPNLTNIAVVNGTASNWGRDGVNLGDGAGGASNGRVEGIRASGNSRAGVNAGANTTISRCVTSGRQYGLQVGSGSTLTACSVTGALLVGINTLGPCKVIDCAAYLNTGMGINLFAGSTASNCSAVSNTNFGIRGAVGCSVIDCVVRLNNLDGILVSSGCTVRGNTCVTNGLADDGAGIHASGNDNRIEGNNCILADRGIDVDVAGNFISRNTCSGNTTNWDVATGNIILVVSGATSGAVIGDSGGVAPGSTDPNANFTY